MSFDPDALRGLGRRFWTAWAGTAGATLVAVVLGAAVLAPRDGWLVALLGVLGVVTAAVAVVSLALGEYLNAAGLTVAAAGWAVLAGAAATGFPGVSLWTGYAVCLAGSAVALWAEHGERVRGAVGV
ncbi:hypothetical protein BRC64_03185 [Halobacteriales archaeon QH_10_67_22]|nr:MAG: hypothetical protein BRC64_03185 [Halobacteriales archaeon QH_10_67_22]